MSDLPYPNYDLVMAYSEALDRHGLLRPPVPSINEESHDDLVMSFLGTEPAPEEDPAETSFGMEVSIFARYTDFLTERGELVSGVIITPQAVADRVYAAMSHRA